MNILHNATPHTPLDTTLPFVFVAKTNVWALNATKHKTEYPTASAMFVSLRDLVVTQTVT